MPYHYLFIIIAASAMIGCASWSRTDPVHIPKGLSTEPPTIQALVNYLNNNAANFQSIQARHISLDVTAQGQSAGLTGWMVARKPRDFRLEARALGNPEVEIGSGTNEFWYWLKRAEPAYQYYCSYADFYNPQRAIQMPFPFNPELVLEVMGMAQYQYSESMRLEVKNKTFELSDMIKSPQGQPQKKTIVFARDPMSPPSPQVLGIHLQTPTGEMICKATILENRVHFDKKSGQSILYPTVLILDWPAEKLQLKMNLMEVEVNPAITPERAALLFTRPKQTVYPTFNLARGPDSLPTTAHR
jgi:hypothetical protein